jgi:hypothetical protein
MKPQRAAAPENKSLFASFSSEKDGSFSFLTKKPAFCALPPGRLKVGHGFVHNQP